MSTKGSLDAISDYVGARLPSDINVTRWLALVTIFFLYFPMLLGVLMSYNANELGFFPLTGFTLEWYGELASDTEFWSSLWLSVKLMVSSSIIATMNERIEDEIAGMIDEAEKVEPDPDDMFERVYEGQTPRIREQQAQLQELRERHGDDELLRDE